MTLHRIGLQANMLSGLQRHGLALRAALWSVAAVTLAAAAISPAHAFTTQTLNASNADGSARFYDPDQQMRGSGNGYQPLGADGPTVQFNGGMRQMSPFGPRFITPPSSSQFNNGNND